MDGVCVRKLCSYLLILTFLTAYGRCVADQLGILHTSGTACCTVVCEDVDLSCVQCPETVAAKSQQPHYPADEDEPKPCQLCFILDTDSIMLGAEMKMPTPHFHDSPDALTYTLFSARTLHAHFGPSDFVLRSSGQPGPAIEQHSRLLLTCGKATPVRGPSVA